MAFAKSETMSASDTQHHRNPEEELKELKVRRQQASDRLNELTFTAWGGLFPLLRVAG